jgi:hypothetical protein
MRTSSLGACSAWFEGTSFKFVIFVGGQGGHLLGVGDGEGVAKVILFLPEKTLRVKVKKKLEIPVWATGRSPKATNGREMTAATNIPWIGLVSWYGKLAC